MTEELSEIALSVAREIVGWGDAFLPSRLSHYVHRSSVSRASFGFGDLNAVMDAVRGFCHEHLTSLEVDYYAYDASPDFQVTVSSGEEGKARGKELCHVLMDACVELERKPKVPV